MGDSSDILYDRTIWRFWRLSLWDVGGSVQRDATRP